MINWQRITDLRDEVGEDDLAEVLDLFCEEVEDVLGVLDASTPAELVERLHFLKGSALNIGFDGMSALCHAAESRLRDDPAAGPDLAAIQNAYLAAKAELADAPSAD